VIGFNVVYQELRAMYDRGCQICCNWSRPMSLFRHQDTEVSCCR